MRKALIIPLALCGALVLPVARALAQTTGQPMEIEADVFFIDDENQTAEFTGNVIITQPDFELTADRVNLTYGEDGASDVETVTAYDNVVIHTEDKVAMGDRADYDPETRILVLTGNVTVDAPQGTVNAASMEVDLSSNTSRFTAQEGERVTGVFLPAE
jgi:lipopolysaccharide export system protein LptA